MTVAAMQMAENACSVLELRSLPTRDSPPPVCRADLRRGFLEGGVSPGHTLFTLPQPHPRPLAVLRNEDHASGFEGLPDYRSARQFTGHYLVPFNRTAYSLKVAAEEIGGRNPEGAFPHVAEHPAETEVAA